MVNESTTTTDAGTRLEELGHSNPKLSIQKLYVRLYEMKACDQGTNEKGTSKILFNS